jgi:hypothetical protein
MIFGRLFCSTARLSTKANVVKRAFESVQKVNVETRRVDFELVLMVADVRNTQGYGVAQLCVHEQFFFGYNDELQLRFLAVDYQICAAIRNLI